MNAHVPADIHWVLTQARGLIDWATHTFPGSTNANEHLHRALSYHIHCSTQAFPALQKDHNGLVYDNLKLQAENQKLNDKISTLDRECETLQDEVDDGKKMVAQHLCAVNHCMATNSHLQEDLRKVRDRQQLAPSHDDLVASVSRLEEELYNVRERLKITADTKKTVIDINGELKKELEEAQRREAVTSELNNATDAWRKEHEAARYTLEGEKGALELGLKHTAAREEAAECKLGGAKRDLDIKIAEVDRLTTSNEDLSRRLCKQERAQLKADTSREAAEDRCHTLQDELSGATSSLEDVKVKAEEADQARSRAELEVSTLQKRLDDEVKTTTELASSMEQEKSESKARLEEEQTKSNESQARQDRLTTELADSDATVKRLESELKTTLVQVTSFEEEKADLSAELDRLNSCEQHLQKELDEHDAATKLLHIESERLVQKIDVLRKEANTGDEEIASLRGKIQQLESTLESSHTQVTASEKEKTELTKELDGAREEHEAAFAAALARYSEEMAMSETHHSKLTQELELELLEMKTRAIRPPTVDVGTNTLPPSSNSDLLGPNLDKAESDKAKASADDTTANASVLTPANKKHARAADCDDQTEPKMSKRARRRQRHRESLGVPASGLE
jgi:chromosome segregation ATPase